MSPFAHSSRVQQIYAMEDAQNGRAAVVGPAEGVRTYNFISQMRHPVAGENGDVSTVERKHLLRKTHLRSQTFRDRRTDSAWQASVSKECHANSALQP